MIKLLDEMLLQLENQIDTKISLDHHITKYQEFSELVFEFREKQNHLKEIRKEMSEHHLNLLDRMDNNLILKNVI